MTDIIVTTPKFKRQIAAAEAEDIKARGGGEYFRTVRSVPKKFGPGDRVFYVDRDYIRGFCVVTRIVNGGETYVCGTTGVNWGTGPHLVMDATSWKWVTPIPHKGFQGWWYFTPPDGMEIVGDWLDPMPPDPMPPDPREEA